MQPHDNAVLGITRQIVTSAFQSVTEISIDDVMQMLTNAGAQPLFTPPAIGEYWPGQGGVYAGQVREGDGTCYHVILADAKPSSRLAWTAALKWAKTVGVDGHTDFEIPTRRASALLYANLSDRFEKTWHWTSTSYSESYAWVSYFSSGDQGSAHKDTSCAARAVRRFVA